MSVACACSSAGFWSGLTTFVTVLSFWQWVGVIILTAIVAAVFGDALTSLASAVRKK